MSSAQRDVDVGQAISKAYVKEMLDLNPIWQSATIVRRRREVWTGKSVSDHANTASSGADPAADERLRQRARRCLQSLEKEFYRLPADKLRQYLQFLHSDRLPEFAAKAKRLAAVARHRQALLGVEAEVGDSKFAYSLLQGLVAPAAEAAALREQYIESIIAERRVDSACNMVKDFVERHPEIYALERDWFNLFLDTSNQRAWAAKYSLRARYKRFIGSGKLNAAAIALFIVGGVVSAVVSSVDDDSRKRSTPRRYVPPAVTAPSSQQNASTSIQTMQDRLRAQMQTKPRAMPREFDPVAPEIPDPIADLSLPQYPTTSTPNLPTVTLPRSDAASPELGRGSGIAGTNELLRDVTKTPTYKTPTFTPPTYEPPAYKPKRSRTPTFDRYQAREKMDSWLKETMKTQEEMRNMVRPPDIPKPNVPSMREMMERARTRVPKFPKPPTIDANRFPVPNAFPQAPQPGALPGGGGFQ